jgi:hypothetical protein
MFAPASRSGLRLLAFTATAAIALAACNGNSATPTPQPTATPDATTAVIATDTPVATVAPAACDLAAADTAMKKLTSYQFKMTLAGSAADVLQDLPIDQADAYTLTGTIVNTPASATDIKIGKFHLIETGGFDYFDADGNGSFTQVGSDQGASGNGSSDTPTDASPSATASASAGSSLAAQFTPESLFGDNVAVAGAGGFTAAGNEDKNGVAALRCTAGDLALQQYGSTLGVNDATWTADVWLAADGGYPVAISLIAKAKDGSLPYEILLDLTKVNDPGNKVTAPTNISGA